VIWPKIQGPPAEEDIDWGYFVGRLDFTFFHPKVFTLATFFPPVPQLKQDA